MLLSLEWGSVSLPPTQKQAQLYPLYRRSQEAERFTQVSRQSPDPAHNHCWCLLYLFFFFKTPSSNTLPSPWSPGKNASVGRVLLFQGQLQPFFISPDLRNLMKLLLCAHTLLDSEDSRTKPKMPGPGGRLGVRLSQGIMNKKKG